MRYLSSISLALIVHVLLSIVVLMALACSATPVAPTPNIDATVVAQVKQKVASTVEAMSPTTSAQASLPTPVPDDLVHVGETIEKQKKIYGPNEHLTTIEIKYRGWSEEPIAVPGPYSSGYYSFNAPPGKKFVGLIFDVTNPGSRVSYSPRISALEILTEPYGDYFDGWRSPGINTEGYAARQSTPEEIEQFAPWYGGTRVGIAQRQTVQMTAIFEIPLDASPVQARVTSFDRPLGFD